MARYGMVSDVRHGEHGKAATIVLIEPRGRGGRLCAFSGVERASSCT